MCETNDTHETKKWEEYKFFLDTCTKQAVHHDNIMWKRFSTILAINALIFIAFGNIKKVPIINNHELKATCVLSIIGIIAITIGIFWIARAFRFKNYWFDLANRIEEKYNFNLKLYSGGSEEFPPLIQPKTNAIINGMSIILFLIILIYGFLFISSL